MALFGNLFRDDEFGSDEIPSSSKSSMSQTQPPQQRGQSQMCGIENQGATCYLNSLLQTLLYTPEFREGLFLLGEDELGKLTKNDETANNTVRVIPIQLQRLFARLLIKNCQSVSTKDLTNSFGWTDNEQFQQHDVQELNRILFSAIESSLVGTSGHSLIQKLYHGKIVNQIRCTVCGRVSERQEDFLDVPVTVSGSLGLEQSLHASFRDVEMLDGLNQYQCSKCNKLVDAEKGAKLRSLPPILTVSLLRFSFDYVKLERFKETRKFTFPKIINMAPYCDQVQEGDNLMFELFSVVIHSGGANGGHYHVYIRDIDALGNWVTPDEEEIVVPTDLAFGAVDFIECDSPIELLQYILAHKKNQGLGLDKLGQEILTKTGTSWNKRFKNKHGPLTKFLAKHDDKFIFDPVHKHVSLNVYGNSSATPAIAQNPHNNADIGQNKTLGPTLATNSTGQAMKTGNQFNQSNGESKISFQSKGEANSSNQDSTGSDQKKKSTKISLQDNSRNRNRTTTTVPPPEHRTTTTSPHPGKAWFDFNDSWVHPIYEKMIEKQFSGKESAYMLFYRKTTLTRANTAQGNKLYGMSEQLVSMVTEENSLLEQERKNYNLALNRLHLHVHYADFYQFREGALKQRAGAVTTEIDIDRRETTNNLYKQILEVGTSYLPCDIFIVSTYKELAAGGHIYDNVAENPEMQLQLYNIHDGDKLFVWNGESVDDSPIMTGAVNEPIYLTVIYDVDLQFSQGYSRSLTLQEFKVILCESLRNKPETLRLKRVRGKEFQAKLVDLTDTDPMATLAELGFKDGDQLLAMDVTHQRKGVTEDNVTSAIYSSKFVIRAVKKSLEPSQGSFDYLSVRVEVDRTISVSELKFIILQKFECLDGKERRLRIEHDSLGLRQPIHEDLSVFDAGISQGSTVVLEDGPVPGSDEITVYFTSESSASGPDHTEVIVKQNITVGQCLQCVLSQANITDPDWHLRKTNWCGEAAELLDDPDLSLSASLVHDGDLLLLERGKLPPKGFICLPVWLHPTPESVKTQRQGGLMSWMTSFFDSQDASRSHEVAVDLIPRYLGEIEISQEATLSDLKQQVMTLDLVSELPVPGPDFMRLRVKDKQRLGLVLRDGTKTLKRLKLTSNSILALQIVPEEEQLSVNHIVLEVRKRIPDTQDYEAPTELIWDTQGGATVHSLRQALAETLFMDAQNVVMAKHFPQRHEWMAINKHSQDMRCDPNDLDHFMTAEDLVGKLEIQKQEDEKRKMREDRKKFAAEIGIGERPKRPEVGISIKVGNFS
ncbi:ubiquitin carboxyl-terminal hydrolase 40-like isoform X2 [Mya arenaria]|uniref:ubiquitin carboxyl-terminal hydrolase 40-like isoform X2 n=1 Tax=Mya arenaria TaxID=6604 RepID=UPI0022E10139|nr:ubiquitin carboxyl-terminal hydrolase 40-like isoform X2 [Mya arenaria]